MKDLGHFIAATVLLGLGLGLVAIQSAESEDRSSRGRQLLMVGRAVGWMVQQEKELEDAPEGLTQDYTSSVAKDAFLGEAVDEAFVLRKTKFIAHTNPERAGGRLDRDSLSDKTLYDDARAMASNVRKNIEEREVRPDLTFEPYPESTVTRFADGRYAAATPAKRGEDFEAMVRIKGDPSGLDTSFPWVILLVLLGGIAVYAGVRSFTPDAVRFIIGSILLAATALWCTQGFLADWQTSLRVQAYDGEAATAARLGALGLLRYTPPADRPRMVEQIGLNERGRASPFLADVRSSTVAGTVTGVERETDGVTVVQDADYRTKAGSLVRSSLRLHAAGLLILSLLVYLLGVLGQTARGWHAVVFHRRAYGYLSPALIGLGVLVFIPVVYGISLGFQKREYNEFQFVGLENYATILSDFDVSHPMNFYFTLGVTLMWTITNVMLHVSIGLFLALLLNDPILKARGVYRVLLVVPWAVPNYITALIWKQMFHREFGAINFFLEGLGFEPVSWFQTFWPAFFTNLATNTWLGFPFMMVVSLGALQSIPGDLYEAAFVDGASRWQRFKDITLPLLMPALVPAVIVGSVWTFNMFNIIYLVSGGAPNGGTDILITEAYRWAFERDSYGYAAAYSTIIFLILLGFTTLTNRVTGATKGAFE